MKVTFRSLLVTLVAGLFISLMAMPAAFAERPFAVQGKITDASNVLGADHQRVESALKTFSKQTGFDLLVVYVNSFDGMSGDKWAEQAATKSSLGTTDILLAIATEDSTFGVAQPDDHVMSKEDFATVAQKDILPAVEDHAYADATIKAADGYTQATESSRLPWIPIIIAIVVVLAAAGLILHRVRRKYERTHIVEDEHGHPVKP